MNQHRNFIVTSSALYNIHKNTINRKIRIRDIAGLSKSADTKNHEFIIHVEDDYDYAFPNTDAVLRDEFFENLKAAYFISRNKNLQIFSITVPMKTYVTSKSDLKKGVQRMPPHGYILESEDYYDPNLGESAGLK